MRLTNYTNAVPFSNYFLRAFQGLCHNNITVIETLEFGTTLIKEKEKEMVFIKGSLL